MEKVLMTGPKGGQYWIDESGKKHYVKAKKSKNVEPLKMKRYVINICVRDNNGCYYDDFNEWRDAYCKEGALQKVRDDYPNARKYELTVTSVRDL